MLPFVLDLSLGHVQDFSVALCDRGYPADLAANAFLAGEMPDPRPGRAGHGQRPLPMGNARDLSPNGGMLARFQGEGMLARPPPPWRESCWVAGAPGDGLDRRHEQDHVLRFRGVQAIIAARRQAAMTGTELRLVARAVLRIFTVIGAPTSSFPSTPPWNRH
jgi:hypothetical protein